MRGLIIDPWKHKIEEVHDENGWSLQAMYRALSVATRPTRNGVNVDDVNQFRITQEHDVIWVDGEFGLKDGLPVWNVHGYPSPLAGRGLVLSLDEAGANRGTNLPIAYLQALVIWRLDLVTAGTVSEKRTLGTGGIKLSVDIRPK